jgi:hypothetical protein
MTEEQARLAAARITLGRVHIALRDLLAHVDAKGLHEQLDPAQLLAARAGLEHNETEGLELLERLDTLRESLKGCSGCTYEEADGALHLHCAECQLNATRAAWQVFNPEDA